MARNKPVIPKESRRRNPPRKKSVEVRVFGFILIGYGLYFIMNFIPFIVINPGEALLEEYFFILMDLPAKLFYFFSILVVISGCIVKMIVPLFSVLYGIEVLRLKEGGRKSLVTMYCINIVAYLLLAGAILLHSRLRAFFINHLNISLLFLIPVFSILVIVFTTRPEVREQFK